MNTLMNSRLGGSKFPVALVLVLTALTLLTTPMVEEQLLTASPEFAQNIDEGSVEFVVAD